MTASQLPLQAPAHRNQQMFSDHYLDHLLPQHPEWPSLVAAAAPAMQRIAAISRGFNQAANEAQLEEDLARPILRELGHSFEVQAALHTPLGTKRPDYVFYRDEAARQAQRGTTLIDEALRRGGIAVGDAKAWDRPLDVAARKGNADQVNANPSYQIAFYMQHSGLPWGILTNGRLWRLYHRDTAHKLDRFYEVDVFDLIERDDPQAFVYFYAFFRRAAFDAGPLSLDALLTASQDYARAVGNTLKAQVYDALLHLAQGLLDHPANGLQPDPATLAQIYDNSLIVLYRLLFILYAEARELLPLRENAAYRDDYSLNAIKRKVAQDRDYGRALLPTSTRYWSQLHDLFGMIDRGSPPLRIAAFNGGLFDPLRHAFLERYSIGDARLQHAIDLLARVNKEFVDYRDLAERHLGTIYEGLLEYHLEALAPEEALTPALPRHRAPVATGEGAKMRETFTIQLLNDKGERKATGSYYTPDYIVKYIVDQTVGPVLRRAVEHQRDDRAIIRAVLAVNVLDPAMGSGHFLVEATDYIASFLVNLGVAPDEETGGEADVAYWKRRVAQSCIYGVDLNPLAVDLAKLSLWLATVAKDRPLSFLDHHLRCGNALVGARLDALTPANHPSPSGRGAGGEGKRGKPRKPKAQPAAQLALFDEEALRQTMSRAVGSMWLIEASAAHSVADVKEQEQAYQSVRADLNAKYGRLADLVTATHFGLQIDQTLWNPLADYATGRSIAAHQRIVDWLAEAEQIAQTRRFFHWELEFPEVFFDQHGQPLGDAAGFDAVVGNPPYGVLGDQKSSTYFVDKFSALSNRDVFTAFMQGGIHNLQENGLLGFILPSSWQTGEGYLSLRSFILTETVPEYIIILPFNTFVDAYVDAGIYIFGKQKAHENSKTKTFSFPKKNLENVSLSHLSYQDVPVKAWIADKQKRLINDVSSMQLSNRMHGSDFVLMTELTNSSRGVLYSSSDLASTKLDDSYLPFFDGSVYRYETNWRLSTWIKYGGNLRERPKSTTYFENPRILIRRIVSRQNRLMATFEKNSFVSTKDLYSFLSVAGSSYGLYYILAILNSALASYLYLSQDTIATKDDFRQITLGGVRNLPIRRIAFATPADERARLGDAGRAHYAQGDHAAVLALVGDALPRGADGAPDAASERSDVVHDLLAFLAEQMIAMNKERQAALEDLLLDLEGVLPAGMLGKLGRLWTPPRAGAAADADAAADAARVLGSLAAGRIELRDDIGALDEAQWKWLVRRRVAKLDSLADVVRVFRRRQPAVAALDARIAATDRLIDQIVYRLYNLADDEIAIVEGRAVNGEQ